MDSRTFPQSLPPAAVHFQTLKLNSQFMHTKDSMLASLLAITLTAASMQQRLLQSPLSDSGKINGPQTPAADVSAIWQFIVLVLIATALHAAVQSWHNLRIRLQLKTRLLRSRRALLRGCWAMTFLLTIALVQRCQVAGVVYQLLASQFAEQCELVRRVEPAPSWANVAANATGGVAFVACILLSVSVLGLLAVSLWRRFNQQRIRVALIHRLEAAQRKMAWIKFYQSNNLCDLPVFRRDDDRLLADYAHLSTAELRDQTLAEESAEKRLPFEQRFRFLLERVRQQDQGSDYRPTLSWRAQLFAERWRKRFSASATLIARSTAAAGAVIARSLAAAGARLRGLVVTMRWQLLGLLLASALVRISTVFDANVLLHVVATFGTAYLRTVMLAWLTILLLTAGWQNVLTSSLPAAYWLHELQSLCLNDALLPLTLPLLLTNIRTSGSRQVLAVIALPCVPWLVLGVPLLLELRWWFFTAAVVLQPRSIHTAVAACAGIKAASVRPTSCCARIAALQSSTISQRAARLVAHLFDEFTGFDFDASLGFPGEGPVHASDELDDYEMEIAVGRQAEGHISIVCHAFDVLARR